MRQPITLTLTLQSLWTKGSTRRVIFEFTGENPIIQCSYSYNLLKNYKARIRTKKLNPLYIREWDRLEHTVMRKLSNTSFCLEPLLKVYNGRLLLRLTKALPESTLVLPESTFKLEKENA